MAAKWKRRIKAVCKQVERRGELTGEHHLLLTFDRPLTDEEVIAVGYLLRQASGEVKVQGKDRCVCCGYPSPGLVKEVKGFIKGMVVGEFPQCDKLCKDAGVDPGTVN